MSLTYVDFLITKAEEQADGTVIVKGPCTTDDVDSDRQIVDPDFAARGLQKWFATGANIREMHQPKAIGAGIGLKRTGNVHELEAHIIEPGAAKLAKHKVLRAFSVGISGAKLDFTKNPKARGGTIVDGEFVEVSLVDRPANAACKVDLVTKAENGDAVFADALTTDVDTPDVIKGEVPVDGEGAEEVIGKGIPAEDEAVTEAIDEAKGDLDDAAAAQADDNAAHEAGGTEGGEMTKGEIDLDIPYAITRLHDHLCAAFHPDAVKASYPAVSSFNDVIDTDYFGRAVSSAITEDAGTGKFRDAIPGLSAAYGLAVDLAKADEEELVEAHAAMHKSFSDAYPTAHLTPGSISAGEFKRPYISSGRANQSSNGANARMPMTANVPSPDDFSRGPLTAGHERLSPSAKIEKADCTIEIEESDAGPIVKMTHTPTEVFVQGAPGTDMKTVWKALKVEAKGRQFYSNNSRDQAASVMAQMHDYIATAHPGICPMSTKADDVIAPAPASAVSLPNSDDAHLTPTAPLDTTTKAEGVDPSVLKAIESTVADLRAELTKVHEADLAKLTKKLAKARRQRDEYAKQADPSKNAIRNGRGVVPSFTKSPTDTTEQDAAEQVEVEKREKVEWLVKKLHDSPDMVTKSQVMAKLEELTTPEEFAAALVTA